MVLKILRVEVLIDSGNLQTSSIHCSLLVKSNITVFLSYLYSLSSITDSECVGGQWGCWCIVLEHAVGPGCHRCSRGRVQLLANEERGGPCVSLLDQLCQIDQ